MKCRLKSLYNLPFLVCLALLLFNDFYLKAAYPSWLTGKLSDFTGLFVFVSFWTALFPRVRRLIYFLTALLFVIWKSPYSQPFIDFFTLNFYTIDRAVDLSDLWALTILPFAFYQKPKAKFYTINLSPYPLALIAVFSFCATSMQENELIFKEPKYLLFKAGVVDFEVREYEQHYHVYHFDLVNLISIEKISFFKRTTISDEFQKYAIQKDLDLRFLRIFREGRRSLESLSNFTSLRDSLTVEGQTSLTLKLDSTFDEVNFKNTRLHGTFRRYSNSEILLMEGQYVNGFEDSIWTFYNLKGEIIAKKYFKGGELIKKETFDKSKLQAEQAFKTRSETIWQKVIHLAILLVLILIFVTLLYSNNKKLKNNTFKVKNLAKIIASFTLPLCILFLSKVLSLLIPNSFSPAIFWFIGQSVLVYIVLIIILLLIFFVLEIRSKLDLIYCILILSLTLNFIQESVYLVQMVSSSQI